MRHSNGTHFGVFPIPGVPVPLNKPGHAVLIVVLMAFLIPFTAASPSISGCVEVGNSRASIALSAISATASCAFFLLPTGADSKMTVSSLFVPNVGTSDGGGVARTGFSTILTVDTKSGGTGAGLTAVVPYSGSANFRCWQYSCSLALKEIMSLISAENHERCRTSIFFLFRLRSSREN